MATANVSDNIQVAVRIRPLIKSEKEENLPIQWSVQQNNIYQIDESGQRNGELYTFDHIFQMSKSNVDIYEEIVKDFIDSALNGLNTTIFAYGQTSSGKTYTMLGTEKDRGLVPLTIDSIFDAISVIQDRKFLLRVSYVEIYNERINDLLDPSNTDIKIREFSSGAIGLQSVKEEIVSKRERVFDLLKIGSRHRHMGSTSSNERSSRSHTIFRILIESVEVTDFDDKDLPVQISSVNLVDLAGTERVAHTKATGLRLKEGGHINKSLSALSLVIRQLSDGQEFANFRDSKLTRLLQHSLGGNAKTLIICTITLTSIEYTNSTLLFAQRAKAVKNKPQINEIIPDSATCKQYALMNNQLKERLEEQLKKNKDLERDKEHNCKEISRLQEQMQMLELFLHGKEKDTAITIPKRRHTICHPVKVSSLNIITEESEEGTQNTQECTYRERDLLAPTYAFLTPFRRNIPAVREVTSDYSTSASVVSTHQRSSEREDCKEVKYNVGDDSSGFSEISMKVEEVETQTETTSDTTISEINLHELEEPLIVIQLTNKFKKREEELVNEIRALEKKLKEKEEKSDEKHDISISTDVQYLQDQLIILQGILKKNNLPCDFPENVVTLEGEEKIAKTDHETKLLDVKDDHEEEKIDVKALINKLDEEKRSLTLLLQSSNEDRNNYKEQVAFLQEQMATINSDYKKQICDLVESFDNEKNALNATIDVLREEKRAFVCDRIRYTAKIAQLATVNEENSIKIKCLEDTIYRITATVGEYENKPEGGDDYEEHKASLEKIRTELDDYRNRSDNETKALKLEIDILNKSKVEDKVTINKLTSVIEEFKTKSDQDAQVLAQMRETIDSYENKIKSLEDRIEYLNNTYESKIACLSCDIDKYKHEIMEYSEALEELTDINKKLENEIANIQKKYEDELAKNSQKLEKSDKDLKKLQNELVTINKKKSEAEMLNEKLFQTLRNIYKKFIEDGRKVLSSFKVLKEETESLKNAKKEMEDTYMNLKNQLQLFSENSDYDINMIYNLLARILDLKTMIFNAEIELSELAFTRQEKEYLVLKGYFDIGCHNCKEMTDEIANLKMQLTSKETQLTNTLAKLRNSQETLLSSRQFQGNVNNVCSSCEELKKQNKNLEKAYHDKEFELFDMQLKSSRETEKLAEIRRTDILDAYRDIEKAQTKKIAELEKVIEDKEKNIQQLKKEIEVNKKTVAIEHQVGDLVSKYEDVEKDRENLRSKYEGAKIVLAQRKEEIHKLHKKISELQKRLTSLEEIKRKIPLTVQCQVDEDVSTRCEQVKKEAKFLSVRYEQGKSMFNQTKEEVENLTKKLKQRKSCNF